MGAFRKINSSRTVVTWAIYFFLTAILLGLSAPVHSHDDNWRGIFCALLLYAFGAHRMRRIGASVSTAFVYGCSFAILFSLRFISMGRFHPWVVYESPPIPLLVTDWILICLTLGGIAAAIAAVSRKIPDENDSEPVRKAQKRN